MRIKRRKWLALLMAVLMVVSLLPVSAFAAVSGTEVAKIGETKYETLQDAVNAAATDGSTTDIVMLANTEEATVTIPTNTKIVLDLAGKTITGKLNINQVVCDLTINDSVGGGGITNSTSNAIYIYTNTSGKVNLTINGGNFAYTGTDQYTDQNVPLKITAQNTAANMASTVNITGGTFTSSTTYGANVTLVGEMNISGGTFTGVKQAALRYSGKATSSNKLTITGNPTFTGSKGLEVSSSGNVDIQGGTYTALYSSGYTGGVYCGVSDAIIAISGGSFNYSYAAAISGAAYLSACNATISGGTFTNTAEGGNALYYDKGINGSLRINGSNEGRFVGGKNLGEGAPATIAAITFDQDPGTTFYANYTGRMISEGNWRLGRTQDFVKVGETTYEDIYSLMQTAGETYTAELIDDYPEAVTIPAGKTLTLDLKGHTITGKLDVEGTLTLKDSVGTGGMAYDGTTNALLEVYNNASLTIEGGTYICNDHAPIRTSGTTFTFGSPIPTQPILNIKGGTIRYTGTEDSCAVYCSGATVTVSGGTIESDHSSAFSCSRNCNIEINENNGPVVIRGGIIDAESNGQAIQVIGKENSSDIVCDLVVKGGTFTGRDATLWLMADMSYKLEGGTYNVFEASSPILLLTNNDGPGTNDNHHITGGIYHTGSRLFVKQDDTGKPSRDPIITGGTFNTYEWEYTQYNYATSWRDKFIKGEYPGYTTLDEYLAAGEEAWQKVGLKFERHDYGDTEAYYVYEGKGTSGFPEGMQAEGYYIVPSTVVTTGNYVDVVDQMPVNYVAQIGETKYETLAEAVAAATAGQTIKLLDNIPQPTSDVFLYFKDNVTLDLNGKTITSGVADADCDYDYEDGTAYIYEGKGLTIKNGTMTGVEGTGVTANYAYGAYIGNHNDDKDNYVSDNVTIEKVTFSHGGLNLYKAGAVTIKDCNVTVGEDNKYYSVYVEEGTVTIDGGTYGAGTLGNVIYADTNSTVTIKDGKFSGGLAKQDVDSAKIILEGGLYSKEPAEGYVADGYKVVALTEDDESYSDGYRYKCVPKTYVAQVGTGDSIKKYESLDAAIAENKNSLTLAKIIKILATNDLDVNTELELGEFFLVDDYTHVKYPDGYYCTPVASSDVVVGYKIGPAVASITKNSQTTYYETLNKATTAAENGDTVVLLKDINNSATQKNYEAGVFYKDITIDLNGHFVKGNYGGESGKGVIYTYGNYQTGDTADLLITDNSTGKGGYLENVNENGYGVIFQYDYSNVTLQNVTIKGASDGVYQHDAHDTLTIGSGASIDVDGLNGLLVKGKYNKIIVDGGSVKSGSFAINIQGSNFTATVKNGGSVDSSYGIFSNSSGSNATVNVSGGTVKGSGNFGAIYLQGKSTVNISGGNVTGGQYGIYTSKQSSKVTVSGGTVSGSLIGIFSKGASDQVTVSGGTVTCSGNGYGIYTTGSGAVVTIDENGSVTAPYPIDLEGANSTVTVDGGTVTGSHTGIYLGSTGNKAIIKDGTVSGAVTGIYVGKVTSGTPNSVTVEGGTVQVTGNENGESAIALWDGAQLTMTGGTVESTVEAFAIANNGSNTVATTINISGGTVSAPVSGSTAIYQAGPGTTTISGTASITGYDAGIEVRNGTVNVSGGSITSTSETFSCNANSNGTTTVGAALAIAQHTTKQDITVNITGGTFMGIAPVNECNPQENDPTPQVNMTVSDGEFWSTAAENAKVFSCVDCDSFIFGGFFTHVPDAKYLAPGRVVRDTTDEEKTAHGTQYLHTLGVPPVAPTVDPAAETGSTATVPTGEDADEGLKNKVIEEVIKEITDNTVVSGDEATNIQTEDVESKIKTEIEKTSGVKLVDSTSQLKITVKSVASSTTVTKVDEFEASSVTTTSAKYDVKPWVTIETTDAQGQKTIETRVITNAELAAADVTIAFRLAVPASMKGNEVLVKHYPEGATAPDWSKTYAVQGTGDNRYVALEANTFSVYEIADYSTTEYVALNLETNTPYTVLADALSVAEGQATSAENARTIVLLKDLTGEKKVTLVEVAPNVTLDLNGHNLEAKTAMAWGLVKNSASTGKLIVAKDHFAYFGGKEMAVSDENVMPVWDTTGGTDGYVFYAVNNIWEKWTTNLEGNPKYKFAPESSNSNIGTILAQDSGIKAYVDFSYEQTDANSQTHQKHLTVEFGQSYLTQYLADPTNLCMYVTLLGTEGVSNITAKSYLKAENCNFSIASEPIQYSGN